jgi:histidine triad (HIT) family protein
MEPNCIFCKIATDDIPSFKVYEDAGFIAFLDNRPQSPGHVQVIPKKHYRYVWDVEDFDGYYRVVHKVAKAIQRAFGTDMVYSRVMGDEVHHAHVWLFPAPQLATGELRDFDGNAEKIKAALGS